MKINPLYAAIALAGVGIAYLLLKPSAVKNLSFGAVNAVSNAGVGVVEGVGSILGIPQTNDQKCKQAQAAGDYWSASKYCSAGQFIGGVFGSTISNESTQQRAETPHERFIRLERENRPPREIADLGRVVTDRDQYGDAVNHTQYDQFGNIIA